VKLFGILAARVRIWPVASTACIIALAADPAIAQSCNALEVLFGMCRAAPVRVERQAAPEHRLQTDVRRTKLRVAAVKSSSPSKDYKQRAMAPAEGVPVGAIAHFVEDPTLRPGDVVVTPRGFLVYRGSKGQRDARAFEPLSQRMGVIAALEAANKRPTAGTWPDRLNTSTNGAPLVRVAPRSSETNGDAMLGHTGSIASQQ
jgi:hypothetical protein